MKLQEFETRAAARSVINEKAAPKLINQMLSISRSKLYHKNLISADESIPIREMANEIWETEMDVSNFGVETFGDLMSLMYEGLIVESEVKQEHPDDSKQVSSEYHRCVKILALLNVLFTYYHIKKLKRGDH